MMLVDRPWPVATTASRARRPTSAGSGRATWPWASSPAETARISYSVEDRVPAEDRLDRLVDGAEERVDRPVAGRLGRRRLAADRTSGHVPAELAAVRAR